MSSWVRIDDRVKTKAEIDTQAQRAARGYASLGVGKGDVIAVYMRNDFAFMEASLAAGLCGAYVVPVNWHNTPAEARYSVFGIPDDEFGEQVCAFIQPSSGAALDEAKVRSDLKQRLAGYNIPWRIEFSTTLPREDTGKIFKRKLKEPFWQGTGRSI